MSYRYILGLDPSGNFHEGKGTTGFCIYDTNKKKLIKLGQLFARDYPCMESYWHDHLHLLKKYKDKYKDMIVVIEEYLLYGHKAESQTNSKMETPKLIGILQHFCWMKQVPYVMQTASLVKTRWTDEILRHKGFVIKKGKAHYTPDLEVVATKHIRDSIRHAVHYATFKNKGGN